MTFDGAIIEEQGVTFGIVVVKSYVLNNQSECEQMINFGIMAFGKIPIILMAQNSSGTPTYYGRRDIVNFLSGIFVEQIPWKTYTIN
ncbi:MAG TPA: hypothetical protein VHP38_02050 [Ruminiclostridium sp.]|nr:hypothetical protein [Ruminiclostridium sp.]